MNDKFMIVPFGFAQKLYDTDGADRIAALLSERELTEPIREQLQVDFSKRSSGSTFSTGHGSFLL